MKTSPDRYDWFISLALTLVVHILMLSFPALPSSALFFPYLTGHTGGPNERDPLPAISFGKKMDRVSQNSTPKSTVSDISTDLHLPHTLTNRFLKRQVEAEKLIADFVLEPVRKLFTVDSENSRSLSQKKAKVKLLPPLFSENSIPERPEDEMWKEVRDNRQTYILGDIFKDSVPASYTKAELTAKEAIFTDRVKADILDGILDMNFSTFIISAEYFYLSKALIKRGLQPNFTLEQAFSRYNTRLKMVRKDLPGELDGYSLIMILQRYARNKFYPGNGSGMLLDSLFHNLDDCEGGTKELLAYLDDIYPDLEIGSNRGMLRTTTGEIIGHMQVYIAPGRASEKILSNESGLIVETTRVSLDSILPYSAGDISPLEDFILRYYPSLIEGTVLAERLYGAYDSAFDSRGQRKIVGTSDHPLKMSYGVSSTLLTAQYYDLSNIRTQKIKNEFAESRFPVCDPQIDPLQIDYTNVFSTFVAIDPKMRKNLIGHYLASLQYWNNEIMPQWKEPPFIATYDDFAGTLLKESMISGRHIKIDAENTVLPQSVESHKVLLNYIKSLSDNENSEKDYSGKGRRECKKRVVLTDELLTFLFQSPEGAGVFFLPDPGEDFPWGNLSDAVLDDCLAVAGVQEEENLLESLESEAARQHLSFRRVFYNRIVSRNPVTVGEDHRLVKKAVSLELFFTGRGIEDDILAGFVHRHSGPSSKDEASVLETAAEQGRTGINSGLLVDAYDFLGAERLIELTVAYGKRDDLKLTLARAGFMVQNVLMLLSGGKEGREDITGFLVALTDRGVAETIKLSGVYTYAQYRGMNPTETSSALLTVLEQKEKYDSMTLIALLNHGLLREDAVSFYRLRLHQILSRLPFPASGSKNNFSEDLFIDLVELIRTARYFNDSQTQEAIVDVLNLSLVDDFRKASSTEFAVNENFDFGIVLNKLYCLALLMEEERRDGGSFDDLFFLEKYIRFASKNPIGKIMISLVENLYSKEFLVTAVAEIKRRQRDAIGRIGAELSTDLGRDQTIRNDGQGGDRIGRIKDIVGDANVIAYMLYQKDESSPRQIPGDPSPLFDENRKAEVFRYLDRLHNQIGKIDFSRIGVQGNIDGEQHGFGSFSGDFYQDDRVRESLSLLAYFSSEKSENRKVKFRKIKDIKSLKDLLKMKIVESSRKATRQDMSLLTLSLNAGNKPEEISQAWEDTLAVLQKHLNMEVAEEQKGYLFAPHSPYLTLNNSGFIYSPEKVEDIHNANKWGGRNDILLSSYLHFKNLPDQLPDWLLRTAMERSKSERELIDRLEEQSFLPMIMECESDREELPGVLFNAKWKIRKPYGEDIFPGTLLLLRMGYLDITPRGDFVLTKKQL